MKSYVALLLCLLVSLLPVTVYAGAASSDLSELALDPHPGARLPLDAELADEAGRRVRLGGFFGAKPVVIVLQYLRCKWICGLALGNLADAGAKLPLRAGRDYTVLAISIDPRLRSASIRVTRPTMQAPPRRNTGLNMGRRLG